MTKSNGIEGFTLIELLLVIAILAIVASSVIVLIGGRDQDAVDAVNKSSVNQLRTSAISYGLTNNGYEGFCAEDSVKAVSDTKIIIDDIAQSLIKFNSTGSETTAGGKVIAYTAEDEDKHIAGCKSTGSGWVAWFELKQPKNFDIAYWCVDIEGYSDEIEVSTTFKIVDVDILNSGKLTCDDLF